VQHALRLACGPGRVEDEERVFGIHRFGRAIGRHGGSDLVQPMVPALGHADFRAGAADDQHLLDHAIGDLRCRVGIHLERHLAPAAHALIGGDQHFGFTVDDAASEGLRRKSAKHDRMYRADAGTGEHRIGRLQDHWHVDGDAVSFLDAKLLEDVRKLADGDMELLVGDREGVVRVVAFPYEGGLVAARCQMAVDTVGRHVEHAVRIPFHMQVAGFPRDVLHDRIGRHPVEALAMLAPEGFGVGN